MCIRDRGKPVKRGIVSYYATEALASAATMAQWLDEIQRLVASDIDAGRLPARLQPALTLLGDPRAPAPGAILTSAL